MKTKQIVSISLLPIALFILFMGNIFGMGLLNIGSFIDIPSMQIMGGTVIAAILMGSDIMQAPMSLLWTTIFKFPTYKDQKDAVRLFEVIAVGLFLGAGVGVMIGLILIIGNLPDIKMDCLRPNIAVTFICLLYFFCGAPPALFFRYRALCADVVEKEVTDKIF